MCSACVCAALLIIAVSDRCACKKKNSLPPVNWRWVEEGDGYVGLACQVSWFCWPSLGLVCPCPRAASALICRGHQRPALLACLLLIVMLWLGCAPVRMLCHACCACCQGLCLPLRSRRMCIAGVSRHATARLGVTLRSVHTADSSAAVFRRLAPTQ